MQKAIGGGDMQYSAGGRQYVYIYIYVYIIYITNIYMYIYIYDSSARPQTEFSEIA